MRARATILMGSVYSGEYVVDPRAVAEAILSRRHRRRPSKLVEAAKAGPNLPAGSEQDQAAPRADLA
jgi:hypothetical protein